MNIDKFPLLAQLRKQWQEGVLGSAEILAKVRTWEQDDDRISDELDAAFALQQEIEASTSTSSAEIHEEPRAPNSLDPWTIAQNHMAQGLWDAARKELIRINPTHPRYDEVAILLRAIGEGQLYSRVPGLGTVPGRLASSRCRRDWTEFRKIRRQAENMLINHATSSGSIVQMPKSLLMIFEEASRAQEAEALVASAIQNRSMGDFTEARRLLDEAQILDPRYGRIEDEQKRTQQLLQQVDRLLHSSLATPDELDECQELCDILLDPGGVPGSSRVKVRCKVVERKLLIERDKDLLAARTSTRLDRVNQGGKASVRVLFLAANPLKTGRLRLDEEVRTIDESLQMAYFRDDYEFIQHLAVRTSDLTQHLLRHTPHIVHFSGHGDSDGKIILEDQTGYRKAVSPDALARLFRALRDNIRCVVLNACFSVTHAEAIATEIDCVLGMSRPISDRAAIRFACGFYRALGHGRSVQTAFDLGVAEIDLPNLNEESTPRLLVKPGVDPKSIIFTKVP
jgi:hypothetical protein